MRSLTSCVLFAFLCLFGCPGGIDEPSDVASGGGGDGSTVVSSVAVSTSGGGKLSTDDNETDKDDGPCPSDVYVLWEKDGIEYTIVIEVFCDPIQNLNLGCPEPY